MVLGKIYYKESSQAPFKAYIKKQDTYYLRCKKEQIINQSRQNKWYIN